MEMSVQSQQRIKQPRRGNNQEHSNNTSKMFQSQNLYPQQFQMNDYSSRDDDDDRNKFDSSFLSPLDGNPEKVASPKGMENTTAGKKKSRPSRTFTTWTSSTESNSPLGACPDLNRSDL